MAVGQNRATKILVEFTKISAKWQFETAVIRKARLRGTILEKFADLAGFFEKHRVDQIMTVFRSDEAGNHNHKTPIETVLQIFKYANLVVGYQAPHNEAIFNSSEIRAISG